MADNNIHINLDKIYRYGMITMGIISLISIVIIYIVNDDVIEKFGILTSILFLIFPIMLIKWGLTD